VDAPSVYGTAGCISESDTKVNQTQSLLTGGQTVVS
jgi:hypothetical protein